MRCALLKRLLEAKDEIESDANMQLGPNELLIMGLNRIVLAPQIEGTFAQSQLECSVCKYYTTVWSKMEYHCKLGTHRFYILQVPETKPPTEFPLIQPKLIAQVPDPGIPPIFKVPLNRTLESIVDLEPPLTSFEVFDKFVEASSRAIEALICELCCIECSSSAQYKLHIISFPHNSRLQTLQRLKVRYWQAFLNPSTNKLYYLSVPDKQIILDPVKVMNTQSSWYGYKSISKLTRIDPASLANLLYST